MLTRTEFDANILAKATSYNVVQFLGSAKQRVLLGCSSLAVAAAKGRAMFADCPRGVVIYAIHDSHGTVAMTIPRGNQMSHVDVRQNHVLVFHNNGEVKHLAYATAEEADAVVAPEETKLIRVDDPQQLEEKLTMAQLVAVYNLLRPEKPVKSFHDMGAGVPRVWNLMCPHLHPAEAPAAKPAAAAPATPNGDAASGTAATNEETDMAAKAKGKGKTTRGAKITKEKTAGAKGRAGKYTDDMIITVLAEKNPKRPESAAGKRFELYKRGERGMTVAKAIEAGVWRADINWDAKQKFIKVSKPS